MKSVRIVQVGPSNSALISNLVSTLNSIQPEFRFSSDSEDVIPYPAGTQVQFENPTRPLEKLVEEYCMRRYHNEYPVGICDCLLQEGILISSDETKALITTDGWGLDSPQYPLLKLIAFALVDILLRSLNLETPIHYEPRACPMDSIFTNKKALPEKLRRSDFCPDCGALLRQAAASNRITVQQIAALYKLLDFVADRKICFVLMPFAAEFDDVYQNIQPAVMEHSGWQCIRVDEIHRPSVIMNLIWEQVHRANLVIADLSGMNPNVFYELGYAHALGSNTILLTQSIDHVPFDLRHRQLVQYSHTPEGLARLRQDISHYL